MKNPPLNHPIVLCILDGWGVSDQETGNAIKIANTPNFDFLVNNYPYALLKASGESVGLPNQQVGNSEVGHLHMGAGRIVEQDLVRINRHILKNQDNKYFNNIQKLLSNSKKCHIIGMLSDGGVHSHQDHIINVMQEAAKQNIEVHMHLFLDGRDTLPTSAINYLTKLEEHIPADKNVYISSIMGRYYGMDRDKRWNRTEKAYNSIVKAKSHHYFTSPKEYIENSYLNGVTDEFILPASNANYSGIAPDDTIIFMNFRADRIIQLAESILDKDFNQFDTLKESYASAGTLAFYSAICKNNADIIFPQKKLTNCLGEVISNNDFNQLRLAETEKYNHVTYFFNGKTKDLSLNEDHKMLKSPNVALYDEVPAMSAYEITDLLLQNYNKYNFIVVNYANADMIGHTGNLKATVEAITDLDKIIGRLYKYTLQIGGTLLITADHGNAEHMIDTKTQMPFTAHTSNKVPFLLVNDQKTKIKDHGHLYDIAPTILELMNINIPSEMLGKSLLSTN